MPAHSASDSQRGLTGDLTSGPDELQLDPVLNTRRLPRWVVPLVGILLAVAAVLGGGYAAWRYNASKPEVVVTASAPRTPWKMVPPLALGEYSRDANSKDTPSLDPATKKEVVSATYSKGGAQSAVLVLSRKETDAKKFMETMSMTTVIEQDEGFCGINTDTSREGCALIRDNTAVLVVDLAGASRQDVMKLAVQFADTLSA